MLHIGPKPTQPSATPPAAPTSTAPVTPITPAAVTEVYRVTGMTCGHCANAVTEELTRLHGVVSVTVDVPAGAVTIGSDQPLAEGDVRAAIDEAGYALA